MSPQKETHDKNTTKAKAEKMMETPIGGVVLAKGDIELNVGRHSIKLTVKNTGHILIQVGSHFHFFEVNRALDFDRAQAFGKRLDIPSSTAIRFEAGDQKEVQLVDFGGRKPYMVSTTLSTGGQALALRRSIDHDILKRCNALLIWDSDCKKVRLSL